MGLQLLQLSDNSHAIVEKIKALVGSGTIYDESWKAISGLHLEAKTSGAPIEPSNFDAYTRVDAIHLEGKSLRKAAAQVYNSDSLMRRDIQDEDTFYHQYKNMRKARAKRTWRFAAAYAQTALYSEFRELFDLLDNKRKECCIEELNRSLEWYAATHSIPSPAP